VRRWFSFCLILGLLFFSAEASAQTAEPNDTPLGWPSANVDVDNQVPLHIVKRIAAEKAEKLWGEVTPGRPIPCCDEQGDIVAYMCPFRIGSGPFPPYAEIMDGVREGRSKAVEVQRRAVQRVSAGTEGSGGEDALTTSDQESKEPDGSVVGSSDRFDPEGLRKDLNTANHKALGIGEYGTIYVSARYDRYPIPLCSHYLSPYYTKGDLAREEARKSGGGEPILGRYYFLGLRGQYFEFLSGEESTLINAHTLKIETSLPTSRSAPSAERLEDMSQDWEKLIGKETP
jgi:hypothetical protein